MGQLLIYKRLPCWYEISWREGIRPAILVRVWKEWMDGMPAMNPRSGWIEGLAHQYGLSLFQGDLREPGFGFDGGLRRLVDRDGFAVFRAGIPCVKRWLNRFCGDCNGMGFTPELDVCIHCDGRGREYDILQEKTFRVLASLGALFAHLFYPDTTSTCGKPQLVEMGGGAYAHGSFSPEVGAWLRQRTLHEEIAPVVDAMKSARRALFGNEVRTAGSFQAAVTGENGWFTTSHPWRGGVYPTNCHIGSDERGYEFSSTCESAMDTLITLAGLAALHDVIRRETENPTP
ncbi:MAG TPA: hypothetical protein VJ837_04175 [Candidatus Paceibacterota bacterium]|nr:hypothetical protein [Candidatus Paceibacterota bacterium]